MSDQLTLAFEFASDLAKQLITLSTGILALTITFTKELLGSVPRGKVWALKFCWATFIISILFGIWTLMALTGTLTQVVSPPECPNLELAFNVRFPAALQISTFVIAMILLIYYAVSGISSISVGSTDLE